MQLTNFNQASLDKTLGEGYECLQFIESLKVGLIWFRTNGGVAMEFEEG